MAEEQDNKNTDEKEKAKEAKQGGKPVAKKKSRALRKAFCITLIAGTFYLGVNYSRIADYTAEKYNSAVAAMKHEAEDIAKKVLDYTGAVMPERIVEVPAPMQNSYDNARKYVSDATSEQKRKLLDDILEAMPSGKEKDMLIARAIRQLSPETTERLGQNIATQMLSEVENNLAGACAQTPIPYCNTLVNKYVLTQQNKNMILEIATIKASRVMRNLDRYVGRK